MTSSCVTPRMRPLSARKSAILCVLDVGTSKVACLIARMVPVEDSGTLRGRTHSCRILGIGHQRSRGIKGGVVVDMEEAENAIRLAVDAAERMARVRVESIIVSTACSRRRRRARRGRAGWRCIRCRTDFRWISPPAFATPRE